VVTSVEDGVENFEWAPDGRRIAYTATEPKSAALKDREKKYGAFKVVEHDYRMLQLFVVDVATKKTETLVSGAFTVGSFQWSPDGTRIAFDHRLNPSPDSADRRTFRWSPSPIDPCRSWWRRWARHPSGVVA